MIDQEHLPPPKSLSFYENMMAIIGIGYLATKSLWYDKLSGLDDLIFILLLIFGFIRHPHLLKSRILISLTLIATAIFSSWIHTGFYFPEIQASSAKIHHLFPQFLFLSLGLLLVITRGSVFALWISSIAALILLPFILGNGLEEFKDAFSGQRVNFGFNNAQHTGTLYGTALIGWIIFHKRIINEPDFTLTRLFLWFFVFIYLFSIVAFSQTRMVFVGLLTLVLVALLHAMRTTTKLDKPKQLTPLLILLLALLSLAYLYRNQIYERFEIITPVIVGILNEDISKITPNSLGLRIQMWVAGFESFKMSPFFGLGTWGGIYTHNNTDWLLEITENRFRHLHSLYVEFLVRFGLIGFASYFLFFYIFIKKLYLVRANGEIPEDVFLFVIYFLLFYAIVNSFEPYFMTPSGIIPFTIVMSVASKYVWQAEINNHRTAKLSKKA